VSLLTAVPLAVERVAGNGRVQPLGAVRAACQDCSSYCLPSRVGKLLKPVWPMQRLSIYPRSRNLPPTRWKAPSRFARRAAVAQTIVALTTQDSVSLMG